MKREKALRDVCADVLEFWRDDHVRIRERIERLVLFRPPERVGGSLP